MNQTQAAMDINVVIHIARNPFKLYKDLSTRDGASLLALPYWADRRANVVSASSRGFIARKIPSFTALTVFPFEYNSLNRETEMQFSSPSLREVYASGQKR
ncbi:MAG: hypothetical protein AAF850_13460 [Pseudomonadota bacterium]